MKMARWSLPSWLSWSNTGKSTYQGAMQAVGGLAVYALAIWLILSSDFASGALKSALTVKLQSVGMATASSSSDTSPYGGNVHWAATGAGQ